ncbi:MAG: hypothetical protein ACRETY_14615 [Steroidobacteraceae bacterium]
MSKLMGGALVLQAGACLLFAGTATAQDKSPEMYVYATYSVCDLAKQDRADEIYGQVDKAVYDGAVTDKSIAGYGYYAHHTGGRWRRVNYFMATSMDGLLTAQKRIGDAIESKNKKLSDEATGICGQHDDYIWLRQAGKTGSAAPGGYSFSTYYVCDSREKQADALVAQLYAPVLDKLVADGKLQTWGWLEHIVGGKFRRLATMTAADLGSLTTARGEFVAAVEGNALGDQFTEICDSHDDYIWEIKFSNP